jgi:hypothetical protein
VERQKTKVENSCLRNLNIMPRILKKNVQKCTNIGKRSSLHETYRRKLVSSSSLTLEEIARHTEELPSEQLSSEQVPVLRGDPLDDLVGSPPGEHRLGAAGIFFLSGLPIAQWIFFLSGLPIGL